MPNIIGEEFVDYVCTQINTRQTAHGAGAGGGTRTNSELIYLNSKSAWVKLASDKLALLKLAPVKSAWHKLASYNEALLKLAPVKSA